MPKKAQKRTLPQRKVSSKKQKINTNAIALPLDSQIAWTIARHIRLDKKNIKRRLALLRGTCTTFRDIIPVQMPTSADAIIRMVQEHHFVKSQPSFPALFDSCFSLICRQPKHPKCKMAPARATPMIHGSTSRYTAFTRHQFRAAIETGEFCVCKKKQLKRAKQVWRALYESNRPLWFAQELIDDIQKFEAAFVGTVQYISGSLPDDMHSDGENTDNVGTTCVLQ